MSAVFQAPKTIRPMSSRTYVLERNFMFCTNREITCIIARMGCQCCARGMPDWAY